MITRKQGFPQDALFDGESDYLLPCVMVDQWKKVNFTLVGPLVKPDSWIFCVLITTRSSPFFFVVIINDVFYNLFPDLNIFAPIHD